MTLLNAVLVWLIANEGIIVPIVMLVAASVVNACLKGPPQTKAAVILDRIAAHNRQGAINGRLSFPLLMRSTFRAVAESMVPPAPIEPTPPKNNAGFAHTAALWIVAALTLALTAAVGVHGCSDPVRRAATITVVSAGSAVAELRAHNRASYVSATNDLRYELADAGGTIEQYDARVAPIDAAYRGRSEAIRALTSDLYAAAAVIDAAHKGDMASVLVAARHALTGLRSTVAVLRDGSVLPALPIPDEVTDAMDALATMAGAR